MCYIRNKCFADYCYGIYSIRSILRKVSSTIKFEPRNVTMGRENTFAIREIRTLTQSIPLCTTAYMGGFSLSKIAEVVWMQTNKPQIHPVVMLLIGNSVTTNEQQ